MGKAFVWGRVLGRRGKAEEELQMSNGVGVARREEGEGEGG